MKIAVIGAGAMGSIYAGLLASNNRETASHEVWAVDVWQQHLDAIKNTGLRIEGASGDRVVTTINVANPDQVAAIGICDLVIIATKASAVGDAARLIEPLCEDNTHILTIQNGLGAGERIARHISSEHVLLGVAQGFGASVKAPGHVHHTGMSLIRIGAMHPRNNSAANTVAKIWADAGFNTRAFTDIHQLIWEKFICNVAFSAPCTVFDCNIGQLMANPESWHISKQCAIEAYNVAKARKIHLTFDDPVAYVTDFGNKLADSCPSMLLDHREARRSEIDAINGMVPVVAKECGLPAPYNEVVSAIVRAKEKQF